MIFQLIAQHPEVLIIPVICLSHVQLQHSVGIDSAGIRQVSLVVVKVRRQSEYFSCLGRTNHTKVSHMPVCVRKHGVGQENAFPRFFKFRPQRSNVPTDHLFIIGGIIKEKAE